MLSCGFVAGLAGGVLSMLTSHPFDVIKIHQQTNPSLSARAAIANVVKLHGYKGFLRGISLPLICSGLTNGLFFASFGLTVHAFDKFLYNKEVPYGIPLTNYDSPKSPNCSGNLQPVPTISDASIVLGGAVAGASHILVGCPIEVIKIKLQRSHNPQGQPYSQIGSFNLAGIIIAKHGFKALYQGSILMLMREIPTSIVYMFTYLKLQSYLIHNDNKHADEIKNSLPVGLQRFHLLYIPFLAGGFAGVISSMVALPLDVAKSQRQSMPYRLTKHMPSFKHFKDVFHAYGLAGFTRGILPLIIRSFPVNGAAFVGYDIFMHLCLIK